MFIVFPKIRLRLSVFALPSFLLMLWLEGALPFAIILFSALMHEFGHLLALKILKYRVRRIDILPMGALIEVPEGIIYRDEAIIAVSGPLTSIILSLVCTVLFLITKDVYALFGAAMNALLGLFNMLPARKLDGGKALCCLLLHKNKKAERICSAASIASKAVFLFIAVLCFLLCDYNLGVAILSFSLLLQL